MAKEKKDIGKLKTKYEELGEEIKKLEEQGEKRWRGQHGQRFFLIDSFGEIEQDTEGFTSRADFCHLTHNYFKTKKEAEAKLALINHIYSFEAHKYGEAVSILAWDMTYWKAGDLSNVGVANYSAGGVMPANATQAQKNKRVRLLKAVYA